MKKVNTLLLGVLTLLTLGSAKAMAECPLGQKETQLSIQRVMRNFGRFTLNADAISLKGLNPHDKVTDAELQVAIEKLGLAIDCAQAVLDNPTGSMLPDEATWLKDKAREDYISDFLYFMEDFRDKLVEYQQLFKDTLQQTPEERDYNSIRKKCLELDKLVEHAHKKV